MSDQDFVATVDQQINALKELRRKYIDEFFQQKGGSIGALQFEEAMEDDSISETQEAIDLLVEARAIMTGKK